MAPIEGQSVPPPANASPNGISLSHLIEYIIQRTYHELTVLSELWVDEVLWFRTPDNFGHFYSDYSIILNIAEKLMQ